MNIAPIGIVDSGSGGLSIALSLQSLLPNESIVYVGDHANLPYGNKSAQFINDRIIRCIEFLITNKCKLIIVACNTATISGIDEYRKQFPDIPIIGVVPVIKTAATVTKTKHFVVLSTKFTAQSMYQQDLIKTWAQECSVVRIGSSVLVDLIEDNKLDGDDIRHELHSLLDPIQDIPYDVIVLGCTHFPFIRSALASVARPGTEILDSGGAVARQVKRILIERDALSDTQPKNIFFSTGVAETVQKLFAQLYTHQVTVTHVSL